MTRRSFSWTLSGALFAPAPASHDPRIVTFEATAGARLPHTLTLRVSLEESRSIEYMRRHVWEFRSYRLREAGPAHMDRRFKQIFEDAGIRPLIGNAANGVLSYWIPFENLVSRDRAWTVLNADPRWISVRSAVQSYHFGLFRLA